MSSSPDADLSVARPYTWGIRPSLTGLRLIAVYVVVLFHAGVSWADGGFVGVDLFFVLSGFLVCNVLLTEISDRGGIRLFRFYARRVRRLLPAAVVMIVATSAIFIGVAARLERVDMVNDARAALLYVANWRFIAQAQDYFAAEGAESPFLHFWSLSIEEQYYFVFPALVLLAWRLRRDKLTVLLPALLGALTLVSLALQIILRDDVVRAYYGTDTRLYQILSGATLAAWLRYRNRAFDGRHGWAGSAAIASIVVFLVLSSSLTASLSVSARGIAATAASLLIIVSLEGSRSGIAARTLSTEPAVFLGDISYGTYLWHWPAILVLERVAAIGPLTLAVVAGTIATALAALSYHLIEQPIRRRGPLDRVPRWVVATGLTASLITAVWIAPMILRADTKPVVSAAPIVVATSAEPENGSPGDTSVAPNQPTTTIDEIAQEPLPTNEELEVAGVKRAQYDCTGGDVADCILRQGTGLSIHVIGDSHAGAAIPLWLAIAEEQDLSLSATTLGSCPWQEGLTLVDRNPNQLERCRTMKDDAYTRVIPELDPDVVVLIHRAWDSEYWLNERVAPTFADPDRTGDPYETTTRETIDRFVAEDRTVIIFEPIPEAPFNPLTCLSGARAVTECTFEEPAEPLASELLFRELAAQMSDVFTVDLDDLVCPQLPICPAVADGVIVRSDAHHLSNPYAVHIAPAVAARIAEAGGPLQ